MNDRQETDDEPLVRRGDWPSPPDADHLLTVVSDADLDHRMPGQNPTLGELVVGLGNLEGVYTHSFETFILDWSCRRLPPPEPINLITLRTWFEAQDEVMKAALDRFTEEELQTDRIDRGSGFIASPFVQFQVYREAVYIYYGKLSVYLKALERDPGDEWAAGIG
jgi:hypothetical protein